MIKEAREQLERKIIPFWKGLHDSEYGGFYGYMDSDLKVDHRALKGAILNSRILWFFANAYMALGDDTLLAEAKHAYEFMKKYCLDHENGGIYWSVQFDGTIEDSTKHTYNQAFAIYALSSYYDASKEKEALELAYDLYHVVEEKCTDPNGYKEAQSATFELIPNDKLSENGVLADKTMNTLLHVLEGYTELYRVTKDALVKEKLEAMLTTIETKIYNPKLHRQEVFFDHDWNSLIDLHSYGHDIETSWLVDRTLEIIGDESLTRRLAPITKDLAARIYQRAYVDHSLLNECEREIDNTERIWWVQAEAVIGFINAYQKDTTKVEYKLAAADILNYIQTVLTDHREGSEWYWRVHENYQPDLDKPIVEPWKCPYHNGRMCMEIMKRGVDIA